MSLSGAALYADPHTDRMENIRNLLVTVMFASAFFVTMEPAPVDLLFFVLLLFFYKSGLSLTVGAVPMVLFLILYNIGGFVSFIEVSNDSGAIKFVSASSYMAVSAIIIAYYIAHDPVGRFPYVRTGLCISGFIAAVFGLIDYVDTSNIFPHGIIEGRATGTFKDPNVFSTFLIFPAILLLQGLMLGTTKRPVLSSIALLTILAGLFLAFSRGAWISFAMSAALLTVFTFILNPSRTTRERIAAFVILAGVIGAIAMAALMSDPAIRDTFLLRFKIQNYDTGETGRFGNQINSIPVLLGRPFGFGPTHFRVLFGADPHNTFLNGFASYGWLGGITFICLVITTIYIGFKSIIAQTPWRNFAIATYCPLLATIFQGIQIDTEHWRHLYWMLGLTWGFFAATLQPTAVRGLSAVLMRRQARGLELP